MIKRVVINSSYGGYGLSKEAYDFLGLKWNEQCEDRGYGYAYENDRENPNLIKCIETLGDKASGRFAHLVIEEFNDNDGDYGYYIDEYDGAESIVPVGMVSIEKIKKCKNDKELIEYFRKLDIKVKEGK